MQGCISSFGIWTPICYKEERRVDEKWSRFHLEAIGCKDIRRVRFYPQVVLLKAPRRQAVVPGNIIIRQRGTKVRPGEGVGIGRDHTIFATLEGQVQFEYNVLRKQQVVSVVQ